MAEHIYTRTIRGTYTSRVDAIQGACNWYGTTVGFTPITEGKRKLPTAIVDPEHHSVVLGGVVYDPKSNQYVLWMYPKCSTFLYIRAGDSVHITSKGWGVARIPNYKMEVWVCTHGIASADNVKSVKRGH